MSIPQLQRVDRAADHFRDAILVAQDVIYGMMGITGACLVTVNAFELAAHPREAGTVVALGAVLLAMAGSRWAWRRWHRPEC